jgi:hypothetical protein
LTATRAPKARTKFRPKQFATEKRNENDIVGNRSEILSKDLRCRLQDRQVFAPACHRSVAETEPSFMKTNFRIGLPSHVTE